MLEFINKIVEVYWRKRFLKVRGLNDWCAIAICKLTQAEVSNNVWDEYEWGPASEILWTGILADVRRNRKWMISLFTASLWCLANSSFFSVSGKPSGMIRITVMVVHVMTKDRISVSVSVSVFLANFTAIQIQKLKLSNCENAFNLKPVLPVLRLSLLETIKVL